MGKFEKKKAKSRLPLAVIGVVTLAVLALVMLPRIGGESGRDLPNPETLPAGHPSAASTETPGNPGSEEIVETAPAPTAASIPEPEETSPISIPEVSWPVPVEDGKLEIGNLFQSTGFNPDFGNEDGKDIATLTLTNTSELLLTEAKITVKLADSTEITFLATHLPAGKTALVFSVDNTTLEDGAVCVDITCEAAWDEMSLAMPTGVTASADGMTVTVDNNTAKDIPELIIYCRTPLGEEYFGGIAYAYTIYDLPANGSITLEAEDCIMGLAEVVRIEIK